MVKIVERRGIWRYAARASLLGLVIVAPALVSPNGIAAPQDASLIRASVGPGRAISLRIPGGGVPPRLGPGRYTVVVTDRSRRDNFHLLGGLDRKTGIAFIGRQRWVVTLQKGIYRYRSDAHPRTLSGSFQVV